eukprot:6887164-Pyramimonas_sp.AAC.1
MRVGARVPSAALAPCDCVCTCVRVCGWSHAGGSNNICCGLACAPFLDGLEGLSEASRIYKVSCQLELK